jgi:hypothetical protein
MKPEHGMLRMGLLFAADWDWVKVLPLLIGVIVWILAQMFGQKAEAPQRRAGQPNVPRPQPQGGGQRETIDAEIEEFLRKASGERRRAEERPRPAKPREAVRPRRESRRETTPPARREAPVIVEVIEETAPRPLGAPLSSQFDAGRRQSRPLQVSRIEAEGEAMEQHVRDVFSHPVGQLAAASAARDAALAQSGQGGLAKRPAAELLALLRGGQVRHAVVLQEILQRPEHRW